MSRYKCIRVFYIWIYAIVNSVLLLNVDLSLPSRELYKQNTENTINRQTIVLVDNYINWVQVCD